MKDLTFENLYIWFVTNFEIQLDVLGHEYKRSKTTDEESNEFNQTLIMQISC